MKGICFRALTIFLITGLLVISIDIENAKGSNRFRYAGRNLKTRKKQINLLFPIPEILKVGSYDLLRSESCSYLTNPGHPMLPLRSFTIKLPEGSLITNIRIDVKERLLNGRFSILPAPTPCPVGSQLTTSIQEDPTIYAYQSYFPEGWFSYREAHGIDSETNSRVKYLFLNILPFRYLPAEKKVMQANSVDIVVDYMEPNNILSSSGLENIIITSPDLEPYARELAEWKNNTGITSRVLNTTWIYGNYGGVDNQERIRNCTKDFVAKYGIVYVTIFGDADQVPVRYAYVPDPDVGETYVPTDLYYADLDGTWDNNGDEIYADQGNDTVDGIPDVYIGRIPSSVAQDAQSAVDKIKGYHQQFDPSQNWTQRIVLAAGTGHNGVEDPFGVAFPFLKDYIANKTKDKEIVKIYETYGNLSTTIMANQINNGCLFLNFAGHGNPGTGTFDVGWLFYWVVAGSVWNGFGIANVQESTNGFKLPVVTTLACSTARFDDEDCIGEWFVLEPDGGSIAYFGATRVAWAYVDEYSPVGLTGEIDWRIYENYFEGSTRLGQMWSETTREYVQSHISDYENASIQDVKTIMEFVLLGDPTLRIYNPDYPETLRVPEDCPTIQTAIDAAYDGDTVFVKNGTYYENVYIDQKNVSLVGENRNTTVIYGSGSDNVVFVYRACDITIRGFSIQNGSSNGHAINMEDIENCTITGNTVTNNHHGGIFLVNGNNNNISGNIIANNSGYGIMLLVFSTIVSNNTITNNGGVGLRLGDVGNEANSNNVSKNIIKNNEHGIIIGSSHWNTVVENSIVSNNIGVGVESVLWFEAGSNIISENEVENNTYGIHFRSSSARETANNTVSKNEITNNDYGLYWEGYQDARILENSAYENRLENNRVGIYLYAASNNTIRGNSIIVSLECGIWHNDSSSNKIYHNNFWENTQQVLNYDSTNAWDDGYPSGGNYWSDYIGADLFSGLHQNETGSDGIGDSPYAVELFQDRYPLSKPYSGPHDLGTTASILKTVVGQGYNTTIAVKVTNYGIYEETFNLTCQLNTTVQSQTLILGNRSSAILTFELETTNLSKGNCTVVVEATPVLNETDISDNFIDCWFFVTIAGDINGEKRVNILDAILLSGAHGSTPADSFWNPNADINNDGLVDVLDGIIFASHFGEKWS